MYLLNIKLLTATFINFTLLFSLITSKTMPDTWAIADKDGHMRRAPSAFRDFVSRDPNSKYPAGKGRYALHANYGCPWAHRALITRQLKGLEDVVEMSPTDVDLGKDGWMFTGKNGSVEREPIFGFKGLREVYFKVEPGYTRR